MTALLRAEGLVVEARTKSGPSVPILKGVDLTIAPGEIVGVIGQSGSGKSTLGLALAGFARPGTSIVSGRVVFDGQDVLSLPPAKRRLRGASCASRDPSTWRVWRARFSPARPRRGCG